MNLLKLIKKTFIREFLRKKTLPPYQVVTKTLGEHATVYIIADTDDACKLGVYDYIRQFPYGNYLTVPTDMGYKADSGKFVASIYRTKEKYRER